MTLDEMIAAPRSASSADLCRLDGGETVAFFRAVADAAASDPALVRDMNARWRREMYGSAGTSPTSRGPSSTPATPIS